MKIEIPTTGMNFQERRLHLIRIFGAPPEVVFRAWTDPQQIAKWWGPRGFTNPVCEFDARPGGLLRIVMRGPDGNEYPMTGTVRQIVPHSRLVFTAEAFFDAHGKSQLENLNTVLFEPAFGGKATKVTLTTEILRFTDEVLPGLAGMEQGWSESLYRLGDLVSPAAPR